MKFKVGDKVKTVKSNGKYYTGTIIRRRKKQFNGDEWEEYAVEIDEEHTTAAYMRVHKESREYAGGSFMIGNYSANELILLEESADKTQEAPIQEKTSYSDFSTAMLGKLDELKELFKKKNMQYSSDKSPLANFAAGALLSCGKDTLAAMYEEAKAYQRKHIAFISEHDITAPKAGESLKDIAIYSLIQLYMWEKAQEESEQK